MRERLTCVVAVYETEDERPDEYYNNRRPADVEGGSTSANRHDEVSVRLNNIVQNDL